MLNKISIIIAITNLIKLCIIEPNTEAYNTTKKRFLEGFFAGLIHYLSYIINQNKNFV